jgi:glycosyltransferase involved in cell wall biosynthesis
VKARILQPYAKSEWPLVQRFVERWPDAVVDCGAIPSLRYRTKVQFLLQLPRLFVFGLRTGLKALRGGDRPEVFVVGTDPEVIALTLVKLMTRKRVPIILCGFIYTLRKSPLLNWCRRQYFRSVLGMTRGVICHSTLETTRYSRIFGLKDKPFAVVPFALNVVISADLRIHDGGYVLSAGRAERDYALLSKAWSGLPLRLHIVCDTEAPLRSVDASPNVTLLRSCYGADFQREIAAADFVVVPIKDKELSAGQMVLLQSMALGKPVIISRTPTTEEYGEHLKTLYFVEHGSVDALRNAIMVLAGDPQLRADIGAAARAHYERHHTVTAYANGVLSAVERLLGADQAKG